MKETKVPYLYSERVEATDKFIKINELKLRTQDEIVEKLNLINKDRLMFDFRPEILINHLEFDKAKPFLSDEYLEKIEKKEAEYEYVSDVKEATQDFLDYMNFAFDKALDERGLSASRSIQKLGMWLWLLNREDLEEMINEDELYNPYGAPALIAVCDQLGIEVPDALIQFSKVKC